MVTNCMWLCMFVFVFVCRVLCFGCLTAVVSVRVRLFFVLACVFNLCVLISLLA